MPLATVCPPGPSWVIARPTVRARDQSGLTLDLTLVMTGFDFESVWEERRTFLVEGVELPVARLSPILRSKAATNRDKDRLFLATQRHMLDGDEVDPNPPPPSHGV